MILEEFTYLFVIGATFAFLDAWNIGKLLSVPSLHPLPLVVIILFKDV